MKVTVEYLYHFNCESCGSWFSIGDAPQALAYADSKELRCPYCGKDSIPLSEILSSLEPQ